MAHNIPVPLVLVEGFLVATSAVFRGNFEYFLNASSKAKNRTILLTSVGPVSSLHDRACELYYELKGGKVDYGELHASEHGHERHGREYKVGLYPSWSIERPLHFLGHSMGGPTITKLIWLMREGFFGEDAHPNMVLSITSVSSPFRGTQVVYTLGEKVDAAPAVRFLSLGSLISRMVHSLAYFSPLLPPLPFDLHAETRRLTCYQSSFFSYLHQMWRSDWAEGYDAAPYDCTFGAADNREASGEGVANPGTWYRSHVGVLVVPKQRGQVAAVWHASGSLLSLSPFRLSALLIASFDFSSLKPLPLWFRYSELGVSKLVQDPLDLAECGGQAGQSPIRRKTQSQLQSTLGDEYWANDGVVPLFSQWHPLPCSPMHCTHCGINEDEETFSHSRTPPPGMWHVHHQPGVAHHISFMPIWFGTQWQQDFWTDLGVWLELVEKGRRELRV